MLQVCTAENTPQPPAPLAPVSRARPGVWTGHAHVRKLCCAYDRSAFQLAGDVAINATLCLQEALTQERSRLQALLAAELQQREAEPVQPPAEGPAPQEPAGDDAMEESKAAAQAGDVASDPLDAFMTDLGAQMETDKVRPLPVLLPQLACRGDTCATYSLPALSYKVPLSS